MVLFSVSCSETRVTDVPEAASVQTLASSSPGEILDHLAKGIALGLTEEALRAAVRNAMRDSPWDEHQLAFRDFTRTEGGRALLAKATGASVNIRTPCDPHSTHCLHSTSTFHHVNSG